MTFAAIIAVAYWYWTGPYQESGNPTYEDRLKQNAKNMRECLQGLNYRAGTGANTGNPEENCANRYNVYQHEGQWHSYDDSRRED